MMKGIKPTRRTIVGGTAVLAVGFAMPGVRLAQASTARTADGLRLHYESNGMGPPILFLHEASRSLRSFDLQVAALQNRYQCIAYNARGYPPSDVPASVEFYSQDIAASDVGAILDAVGLSDAHLVGVSMGSAAALQFALTSASRVRSIVLCSIGAGSDLKPGEFAANMEAVAAKVEASDDNTLADILGSNPDRQRLKSKNPIEFRKFMDQASGLSRIGLANTFRGVQKRRPPIYAHREQLAAMTTPTLIVAGELDGQCIKPSHFLAETIPSARLEVLTGTGHSVNIEEPTTINQLVANFVAAVDGRRLRPQGSGPL
jgi:pimeloyl-ACP methyl ester carboxylesterase